jgi:hypothetical protein
MLKSICLYTFAIEIWVKKFKYKILLKLRTEPETEPYESLNLNWNRNPVKMAWFRNIAFYIALQSPGLFSTVWLPMKSLGSLLSKGKEDMAAYAGHHG